MSANNDIGYWGDLVIAAGQGTETATRILQSVPSHLYTQVVAYVDDYYLSQGGDPGSQEDLKEKYKNDVNYGIEIIKKQGLETNSIKLKEGQSNPYNLEEKYDMETLHSMYADLTPPQHLDFATLSRTTASANQTDILPHLFKKQDFFNAIEHDLDKTIVTSKEGMYQYHFLTRVRKRASGSLFRKLANTTFADELQAMDKTVEVGEVMEKKIENANPFKGKFTFRTSYGPPPTASLSMSAQTATAMIDLGVKDYGPGYIVYNTTTGSLSSGSLFQTGLNTTVTVINIPGTTFDKTLGGNDTFATTASTFQVRMRENPSTIKYIARWEQNINSASSATIEVPVTYAHKAYQPSILNGNIISLYPTKKTVLQNGNIFIT